MSYIDYDNYVLNLSSQTNSTFNRQYIEKHRDRFLETIGLVSEIKFKNALEIGATDFFQIFLSQISQGGEIWGTIFDHNIENKFYSKTFISGEFQTTSKIMSLDIESDIFPIPDDHIDLILFCEVIEHMDIDPMFPLIEFNRILSDGGTLVLTTPNCCSARNLLKIIKGYRPHFFMQYEKSRSPYRHNFEYDVHALTILLDAAGFTVDKMYTKDVFEERSDEAWRLIEKNNFDKHNRGDDIFIVARKVGPIVNRWPEEIYV